MSYESIQNFYEKRVIEHIRKTVGTRSNDDEYLADIACVALNSLPPRYIRYEVDLIFYLTPKEQKNIDMEVADAVTKAITIVDQRKLEARTGHKPLSR